MAKKLVDVDYSSRYGIVATAGSDLKIVGHAMYVKTEPRKAELALAVADEYQGRGLGTILLGQLAEAAATAGIDVLEAVVKPKNHRMRITPITRGEAARMIRSLKTFPLLDGYRGAPGPTCVRWRTCSCAVSALVEAHQEVAEMDLNPLIVHAEGAVAVDARIRLEPGPPRPPIGSR